jgi:hypothetical protein
MNLRDIDPTTIDRIGLWSMQFPPGLCDLMWPRRDDAWMNTYIYLRSFIWRKKRA